MTFYYEIQADGTARLVAIEPQSLPVLVYETWTWDTAGRAQVTREIQPLVTR